jgi:hypothetical protein
MDKKCDSLLAAAPKTVRITFHAKDGGQYEMKENGVKKASLVFNKTGQTVGGQPMKKKDYFLIEFTLKDETTAGNLQVPPNPIEAFWVCTPRQQNPPICPQTASYDTDIFAVCVDPDKDTLTVRNEDDVVEDFMFTLRFLPAGADPKVPANYVAYDPIGQNQNGGS